MLLKYAVCTTRVPAYAVTRQLSTIASRSALHVPKAVAYDLFQRLAVPAAKFHTTAGAAAEVKSEEAKPKRARKTGEKKAVKKEGEKAVKKEKKKAVKKAEKKAPKKKKAAPVAKRIKKPVGMPRGSISSYNVFFLKFRAEHAEEIKDLTLPECSALIAQAFNKLSTAELEELKQEAKERNLETKKKLAEFVLKLGPAGVALENKRRQERAKRLNLAHTYLLADPFKPKHGPLSGLAVFLTENLKLPEYADMRLPERFKHIAGVYKSLPEDQKLPYVNRGQANRATYYAEKEAYEKLLKEDQEKSAAR